MDSSSDSEGCQLYTRTAENIRKKREQLKRLQDFNFENDSIEIDSGPIEELCSTSLVNTLSKVDQNNENFDTNKLEQEEIPLETRRNLRSNSEPKPMEYRNKRAKAHNAGSSRKRKKGTEATSICDSEGLGNKPAGAPTVSERNVIVLDDDFEFTKTSFSPIEFNKVSQNSSLPDLIIDDDDYDDADDEPIIISIEWTNGKRFSCKQFKLNRYQKFVTIFEELGKIEGLPTNRISLMRDSKIITPADTPESLDLKYYAGLTGSVSATVIDYGRLAELSTNTTENKQEGLLAVQLRLENQRTLKFTIMKHQKISVLYKKCSEELKCRESLIKLVFDGDCVEPNDFVSSLDLEDDDIFNVYLKKE